MIIPVLHLIRFVLLCCALLFAIPDAAYAKKLKTIAFLIPETPTKVMAEGISKFKEQYPGLAQKVNILVYPNKDLQDKLIKPDLSIPDVIFLCHLDYKVMLDMEEALKKARQRGAKVIGLGADDVFREKGYYNVDINTHPEIAAYWEYSGSENVKRLIAYLLREFAGMADITVEPPIEMPLEGIYHPDAPGSKVFETLESYLKWYETSGHFKVDTPAPPSPSKGEGLGGGAWVGLLAYNTLKANDNMVENAIIRQLEKEGLNVICTIGYPAEEMFEKYLLKEGNPQVDIVISLMFSHPKEKSVGLLAKANIPILMAIKLYSEIEKWEQSPQGIEPFQLAHQVFLPELSGLIEPIVVGGKHVFFDEKTGVKVTEGVPVNERINKLVKRLKSWLRLKGLSNPQKRVAIIYYNHHTGKQNIGASYLELFASLQVFLESLKGAGYFL